MSELEIELEKVDVKIGPQQAGDGAAVDFFIRYSRTNGEGLPGEDITVQIHRVQPDITGRHGLVVLEDTYPLDVEGLRSARMYGLSAVRGLYPLPDKIKVVEPGLLPEPVREGGGVHRLLYFFKSLTGHSPCMDYGRIYRVSEAELLKFMAGNSPDWPQK